MYCLVVLQNFATDEKSLQYTMIMMIHNRTSEWHDLHIPQFSQPCLSLHGDRRYADLLFY